ncbi:hypothetical protein GCM10022227_06160 [Streptomyces sedi]
MWGGEGEPIAQGHGTSLKAATTVDKRYLLNPRQTADLLAWVQRRPRGGERLHAYFATLYYAGLRPEEAVALRVADIRSPDDEDDARLGELVVHTATPEIGRHGTNSGKVHDERRLKGRAEGEVRVVPCLPALVKILRGHMDREGLRDEAPVFRGKRGDRLAGSVIRHARRLSPRPSTPHRSGAGSTTCGTPV